MFLGRGIFIFCFVFVRIIFGNFRNLEVFGRIVGVLEEAGRDTGGFGEHPSRTEIIIAGGANEED